ncbi:hypothetical protein Barb4_02277 [Bacteroidales bacterium Barb4]|nr:hypothetical protein Barb4_02277 [Bacteroidales bacterium Barb4]
MPTATTFSASSSNNITTGYNDAHPSVQPAADYEYVV